MTVISIERGRAFFGATVEKPGHIFHLWGRRLSGHVFSVNELGNVSSLAHLAQPEIILSQRLREVVR